MEKNQAFNFKDFLLVLNKNVSKVKEKEDVIAVPFYPNNWETDKIYYDCVSCYSGKRLRSGDIPYYCTHPEIIETFLNNKSKPTKCIGCLNYKSNQKEM